MPSNPPAMPSQQRVWRDEPALSDPAWQRLSDRPEKGPVVVFDDRFRVLASKDRELVAQHDDLEILRAPRPDRETDQSDEKAIQTATHPLIVGPRFRRSSTTTGFPAPTRNLPREGSRLRILLA